MPPRVNSQLGLLSLNVTQFCGAANDNILKQVVVFGVAAGGIWAEQLGEGAQAIGSLCLAVPFVLFSGFAGQFSDRYSKRDVCVLVKLWEVVIALLALAGLWLVNLWLVLGSLILIATQSAFFGPAKYGILPEILEHRMLSRANGTINMFTYIAVILGCAIGGPLYDAYAPDPAKFPNAEPVLWLPGLVVLIVGIIGTAAAFGIPRLTARNPGLKIRVQLFRPYLETWREIAGTPLVHVLAAWSYFYFIVGGVAMLILPDYKELLQVSATQAALLMAILGIAIGVGDFAAGRISGHAVRPGLIPIGAIGTTAMYFVLGIIPLNFALVATCLAITGFLAGFYMVPLQTMTQTLSTEEQRGRVLGLWSCLSFVSIILGNVLFLVIKRTGMESHRVFLVCGVLGLICVGLYYAKWRAVFTAAATANLPDPSVTEVGFACEG
ncbi:MAG: MFS transporter [Planctomycetes bacterium]|nr:MFS transporter [Planctomycetota bacterium]